MNPIFPKMSAQEMVALNREYVFFSWSVQSAVTPIPVERAEGVYFWDSVLTTSNRSSGSQGRRTWPPYSWRASPVPAAS